MRKSLTIALFLLLIHRYTPFSAVKIVGFSIFNSPKTGIFTYSLSSYQGFGAIKYLADTVGVPRDYEGFRYIIENYFACMQRRLYTKIVEEPKNSRCNHDHVQESIVYRSQKSNQYKTPCDVHSS